MRFKRLAALGLAAVMVMSSSVVAFADNSSSGSQTGSGKVEGVVSTDVYSVVLPTTTTDTYKFVLDPQGLISKTSNAAYTGATFETGTLFFQTETNKYTNTSAEATVTNKSSFDVNVSIEMEITDAAGVALSTDKTFADDTTPSMYLAIKTTDSEVAVSGSDKAVVTKTLEAAPSEAFEYKYDTSKSEYSFALKDEGDLGSVTFKSFKFSITGASNAAADWTALKDAAPAVKVVWNVVKASEADVAPVFSSSAVGEITYTSGSGDLAVDTIDKVTAVYNGRSYDALTGSSAYSAATVTGSKITLDSRFVAFFSSAETTEMTVHYTDANGDTHTAPVSVKTKDAE